MLYERGNPANKLNTKLDSIDTGDNGMI